MKMILLLLFVKLTFNLYSEDRYAEKDFYNVSNLQMNILKVDNEVIFYGSNGGVLRSYDNQTKWVQNYSGTKSNIFQMIYSDGRLIGVTEDGNIMTSDDKGNWWKFQKLANTLYSITKINDILVASSESNTLFYSYDNGNNWIEKNVNDVVGIPFISNVNNNLIINTSNFKIYISKDIGESWEELDTPMTYNNIYNKENTYAISNNNSIAILTKDFKWKIVYLATNSRYLTYIVNKDTLITFTENIDYVTEYEPKVKVTKYNWKTNENDVVSIFKDNRLGFGFPNYLSISPKYVSKIGDTYYFTGNYKTILRSNDLINWEVVSYASTRPIISEFGKDTLKLGNPNSDLSELYTTNKCATFQITDNFLLEYDNKKYLIHFKNKYKFNENETLYLLNDQLRSLKNDTTYKPKKIFIKSSNGGKTIKILDVEMPPKKGIGYGLGYNQNKCYVDFNYKLYRTTVDTITHSIDSTIKHNIFTFDVITEKFDSLFTFDSMNEEFKIFFDENRIWIYRGNVIYFSTDKGKNFREFQISFPFQPKFIGGNQIMNINKSKSGDYYILTGENILKLDTSDFSYKKFNFEFDAIGLEQYSETQGNGYFDEQYFNFFTIDKEKNEIKEAFVAKLDFSDSVKISSIWKINETKFYARNSNDDVAIMYGNTGSFINLYLPIEKERLDFYTSADNSLNKNYLYTYPAFPQPSNSVIKIKIDWDVALPLVIENVNIYNIHGVKVNVEGLELVKETSNSGYIILNCINLQTGVYFVKINYGYETRTIKLIVD